MACGLAGVVSALTGEVAATNDAPRSLVLAKVSRPGRDLMAAVDELIAAEGALALTGPSVATSIPAATTTALSAALQVIDRDDFANMPRHYSGRPPIGLLVLRTLSRASLPWKRTKAEKNEEGRARTPGQFPFAVSEPAQLNRLMRGCPKR